MSHELAPIASRGGLVQRHRGLGPCPVCGADRRGREDRRPPVALFLRDGEEHWHCKVAGCGAGGGAAALLAAIRFREIPGKGDPRWVEVYTELEDRPTRTPARPPQPARTPARPSSVGTQMVSDPYQMDAKATARPPEAPGYPPLDEVLSFWGACWSLGRLAADDATRGYLRTRGLDVDRLSLLDLSRSLPADLPLPRWVPVGGVDSRVWTGVYRLVTPMFDAAGALRSLRFRAIGTAPAGKKALNPRGYGYGGLVMADPMGIALLRGARADEDVSWDGRVIVVEGEPDFWTWACHPGRFGRPSTWAVLGVVSGSWSEEIAARIPDKARVVIRTHHDEPGQKYAERIRATFSKGRCDVLRSTPSGNADATKTS